MVSTLSYLESIAFRENFPLVFAGLRLAQIAVEIEAAGKADAAELRRRVTAALAELDQSL